VSGAASSDPRTAFLRVARILGAVAGYGCIAAFLSLISAQIYRWLRDGQWTHVGVSDGLSAALTRCCVNDGDTGRLAALVRWLDAPVDWLGLHRVLELLPASLALFALAILGNSLFIYCCDRLDQRQRGA
jgi:FPC/CPF motif-containing protein YcgG